MNDSKKELEEKVSTLEKETPEKLTPEQIQEKQANEFIEKKIDEGIAKRETAQKEADTKKEEGYTQSVQDSLDENQDVKKADFMEFLEKQGDSFTSVKGAMDVFKQLGSAAKDAKAEGQEEERSKPDLPSSEGETAEITEAPPEDANKSFRQVIAEAMKGAVGKSE